MRHFSRRVGVALLVVVAGASGAWAQEAVDLRPRWEAGHSARYYFWTTRDTQTAVTAGGRSQTLGSRVDTEGEVTWRVEEKRADGSYVCTMTLDWMTADLTQNGRTLRNDSRQGTGEAPPIHGLLNAMEGVPLRVEVAADGRVTKVDGVDAMRRKTDQPDIIPEELDFLESATDLATLPGVPAELTRGGTWKVDHRWTHDLGHVDYAMTWKLDGVEEIAGIEVANLSATARERLDVDRSQLPQPGQGPSVDVRLVSSSYQGQVMFDLSRHEAVGRNSTDTRVIDMTIRVPAPVNQTMTRRMTETITSQTLRIEEGGE